ncbi:MAG: Crp/Fnr family transcriptional regulator [Sphingopyxis sp.]
MLIDLLNHCPWFSSQPAGLRALMAAEGRLRGLDAGQTVYLKGDGQNGLWMVLDGRVKLEMAVGPNKEALVNIARAGSVFGRSVLGNAGSRPVAARATTTHKTTIFIISGAAIERIATQEPLMWRALAQALQHQLESAMAMLGPLLALPPPARVAARLRQLAQGERVDVAQGDLADLSGLSRRAVNVHLGSLERAGMIERHYGGIIIRNDAALAAAAAG